MDFGDLIIYAGYILLFINLLLFLKSYQQKSVAFKMICSYLLLSLIIQLYAHYLAKLGTHNLFLSHYFYIGQFLFLSIFFLKLSPNKMYSKIILYLFFLIPLILIGQFIFFPVDYTKFNVLGIIITSVPLAFYSFIFFIQKIDSKDRKYIYFNSGFFVYLICSTLLFSAGNITSKMKNWIWDFNTFLYLFYQLLILLEWHKNFRKSISSKKNKPLA